MDSYLAGLPLLKTLPNDALERLSQAFILRRYGKGETIFEEGSAADAAYFLRSGLVKAVKYSPAEASVLMELIVPGRIFGMLPIMDGKPYPVTVVCIQPSSAYRIRSVDFQDLMRRHAPFSRAVYAELGSHMRHSQNLRALSTQPAEQRIAYILWMLAGVAGTELRLRREEIAEMAGTTIETAIRVVGRLRDEKLLSAPWGRISVLKPESLLKLSGAAS
jgi:CRP/FNR family transcriptional regulator